MILRSGLWVPDAVKLAIGGLSLLPAYQAFLSRPAVGGDPDTKVLLHMDGTDGSTTFTDEIGKTWTAGGDAQIDTLYWRMGLACGLFDGTGDWIYTSDHADFNVGSSDFTVDTWVRVSGTGLYLFGQMDSSASATSTGVIGYINGSGYFTAGFYSGSTPYLATSTKVINDSNWHHIALVRYGNTMYVYVDGANSGSVSVTGISANNSTNTFSVGRGGEYNGSYTNGRIDEFRFSLTARWTSSFTPQHYPYGESDPIDDSYSKALLHFQGDDGSLMMYDCSGKLWGVGGNAQIDTAQYKFGTGSVLSDGNGDYIYRSHSTGDSDFAFGTGDFTIDFRVRLAAVTTQIFYDSRPSPTPNWYPTIYINSSGNLIFFSNANDRITGTTAMTTGVWYHVALARSGTSTKLFLDGTQEGSTYSDSNSYLNGGWRPIVLNDTNAGVYCLNGWMDELRVSKGIARWTSNFTPPTSEY